MPNSAREGEEFWTLTVVDGEAQRLDTLVARESKLSRTRVHELIAAGRITVDGRIPKKSEQPRVGSRIAVSVPSPEPTEIPAEPIPLDILYEDSALCVVNKPAGMVTHPAPGHRTGTLVNAIMHAIGDLSGVGGRLRPGIVHRLDKDTSGLLVIAKNDVAHRALQVAISRREVRRVYAVVAWGRLPKSPLVIDAPLARHPRNRKRMAVVAGGRLARTTVRLEESWLRAQLLEAELATGRTHQIRVHLAHLGHPVVGDTLYGVGWERGMGGPQRAWAMELARRTPRQFLHARALTFDHPLTGERMAFRSRLPDDLRAVRDWARSR